ncbi:glycerophosphoinositol inositolphosphodiesterase GDPD2 [Denticeps clupeoides]|uniref:GP-PDE domain-containing protein n=1 Tax=Denticeps clupeoides TaxID=299321 RepID=A0AAY4E8T6_9TELE|nr:glycerophosphoinositol inositolphosphodiesterase GDPD2 [Denticeps clupeoides]XP_028816635.1 glycerophosphoinositol inositolphosphodiesterase GDPD2 [Denticeps clupeoides]
MLPANDMFRSFVRWMYSCQCRRTGSRNGKFGCCWFVFVAVATLLFLTWKFIWTSVYNSRDDMNTKVFEKFNKWVNWFMVVSIISAVLAIYSSLLLLFALIQYFLKEPLQLHCVHKVMLCVGLLIVFAGIAGMTWEWKIEWPTVLLFLKFTAPFLQLGGVVALTLLSWLVFQSYHQGRRRASKIIIVVTFVALTAVVYLSPLLINSPCVLVKGTLPFKPALVGHRGAPMMAPENTMMSFVRSLECNVTAFETDVQLSKDRIPILMHDKSLTRTTNVQEVYRENKAYNSSSFTLEELHGLNAGKWFVENNPFHTVSLLSEEDKIEAQNQTVPSLAELLKLAKEHNISVIFDLKHEDSDDNERPAVIDIINRSGISPHLIWWLPSTNRAQVKAIAPFFRQVYSNVSEMKKDGGNQLNVKYTHLDTIEIRERENNVSVNMWVVNERWLFSLLWCSGVSSATTNSCHVFKNMSQPDWQLDPNTYKIIWIAADLLSLLLMCGIFCLHRNREPRKHAVPDDLLHPLNVLH